VGDHIRGMFAPSLQSSRGVTIVARKATSARTATRTPTPAPAQNQQRRGGNRPQASGRVYAMIRAEAASSCNVIIDHCMIAGKACCVL